MANVQQLYQTLRIPEYRRFGMNLIQDKQIHVYA